MSIDLNIEGQGEVSGWSPPITEDIETPGFTATRISLYEAGALLYDKPNPIKLTRNFIDKLFQKGYIIAKYNPD
jgi:hypothetical protein